MKRRTFDVIASLVGLALAAVLVVAGGLLTWAHSFTQDQVHNQLAAEKIFFPSQAGIAAQKSPEITKYVTQYAGQQVLTGDQAEVFADHYIKVHLQEIGQGQTYADLSGKYQGMTDAQKASPEGQALNGQVQTMFRGETLRGLLLNAYAFGKMGTIAGVAAIASFVGAGLFLILGGLGLWHSRKVESSKEIFVGERAKVNA